MNIYYLDADGHRHLCFGDVPVDHVLGELTPGEAPPIVRENSGTVNGFICTECGEPSIFNLWVHAHPGTEVVATCQRCSTRYDLLNGRAVIVK